MRKVLMVLMVLGLSSATLATVEHEAKGELKTPSEELSYVFGTDIGMSLKRLEREIDLPAFFRGVEDSFNDKDLLITPEKAAKVKEEFIKEQREAQARKMKELGEKNSKEGEAFLAKNKKKKGVITTDSGLQYMVLNKGKGPKPTAADIVSVNYRGTLIDGTEFDSSYKRGEPVTFPVKGVIAGWTEALLLMNVGSKYKLFLPPNLGYGEWGSGQLIGPEATLIFEVELLDIKSEEKEEKTE